MEPPPPPIPLKPLPLLLKPAEKVWLCRGSSDDDSPWTNEKMSALQAEKDAVEEELLEHLADQDVKQLKWRAVSTPPPSPLREDVSATLTVSCKSERVAMR